MENISGVGGLYFGDTNHDGEVNADDIDTLYAHIGVIYTGYDVALNYGFAGQSDVDALVHNVLGTEYGDANLDGKIDDIDATLMAANWGSGAGWAGGDFNGDGIVDAADAAIMADNWLGDFRSAATNAVPEPSSILLLAIVLMGFVMQNRCGFATRI